MPADSDTHVEAQITDDRFRVADWIADPAGNRVSRDGRQVRLEPDVMRVLVFLARHHRRIVDRRALEAAVWPGRIVTDDTVTDAVVTLRRALGDRARRPRYIETVGESGYRLVADLEPLPAAQPAPAKAGGSETVGRAVPASDAQPPVGGRYAPRFAPMIPGLLVAIPLIALAVGWWLTQPPADGPPAPATAETGRAVVAVLPFESLSADPERGHLAGRLTRDLIAALSRLPGLEVVPHGPVMAYLDSNEPGGPIARALGADYLVRGSVRQAGDRLRIHVRLTDPHEDRTRWAERYDHPLADIPHVRDEIAAHIVAVLRGEQASR